MNRLIKNLTRYKLVTFDVTDTLLEYKMDPGNQYAEAGLMFGVNCEPAHLAINCKKHLKNMSKLYPNFGRCNNMPWENWWKMVVYNTFNDCPNETKIDEKALSAIANQLISKYEDASVWNVAEGSRELLNYLHESNICLGVISNFDTRLLNILKNVDLDKNFKFIITSYSANCQKPDPEIFHKALESSEISNIKPIEALHIGNTPLQDYVGARNAGWSAILMTNKRKLSSVLNNPNVNKNHVYTSFFELQRDLIEDRVKW